MLSEDFTAVSASRDSEELFVAVLQFCRRLEFDTMTAMAVLDHPDRETEFRCVDNAPPGYLDMANDPAEGRRDPVMQHCRFSSLPIVWNQDTYVAANCADKWEGQARHGYRTGVALALHLPQGQHLFVGFDRDQALPRDASRITRIVADMQLFAVLACEAAFRVLFPERSDSQDFKALTGRELECLRWTMEGKTAWEVGKILSISQQTAVRHVNNATHKLGCINKHQAVLKALRLGLIR